MSAVPCADVAIVGAGPAGAWAAVKLARAGARVTLFDHSHPREKPCGGGLTGRAVELVVRELGALPVPMVTAHEARFERAMRSAATPAHERDGDAIALRLVDCGASPDSSLVITSRAVFDRALLDTAIARGAGLIAERVVDVASSGNGVTIRTQTGTYRADMLLGADGANSLVRRRLATPFARAQLSVGTGYFVRGTSSRDVVIRWVSDPPGYLWSFPRADHLAVGVCAQGDSLTGVDRLQRAAAEWITAAQLADPASRCDRYSWPIPSLRARDFGDLAVGGDRWMLVGDAAGLVDPLTREGIFYALLSGEMAALSIARSPNDPVRSYRAQLHDTLVPELRRAASLKAGFFRANFSRLMVHALAESAAIRAVMVDLVGGRQPYIGLRRRLLGTRELGWALTALGQGLGSRLRQARFGWTQPT
jgi:geranylgeranyl reductase family protein